jgi:hypothetical protein
MTTTLTRELAHAAGRDAANRHMRAAGRKVWNEEDFNVAIREFTRLWPLEQQYPWATPGQIADMRRQLGYDDAA